VNKYKVKPCELRNDIYEYVCNYWIEHFTSPTIREIGRYLGVDSTSHVKYHLNKLSSEGLLKPCQKLRARKYIPVGLKITIEELDKCNEN